MKFMEKMTTQYKGQFPKFEFSEIRRLNPYWSSLYCFNEVVKNRKTLHPRLIRRWFTKLVEADDYDKKDKNEIVGYAIVLAKG